jgi:glycosyltransferase involved in cell wall biosynthesis
MTAVVDVTPIADVTSNALRAARPLRIALVHDYFTQRGGAERLAERMAALYPEAAVFTSVIDPATAPRSIDPRRITTSRLQRLFSAGVPLKALGPLMGSAFRALDIDQHDVVVSSSAAFGHHIRPGRQTVHVCYCNTPPAFLYRPEYFAGGRATSLAIAPVLAWMRRGDRRAADRVDRYVANSHFTAARIRASYGIEADVLYPAVDTAAFVPSARHSGRFLVVSRLRPHKAIDLAIAAANMHRLPLDVIGEGSDRRRLQALAGPTVRFLGWQSDDAVALAMAECIALVVPGVEDFGMVSAEVQAAGRPPIGSALGGTAEIVRDGVTGYLVAERTAASFGDAMLRAAGEALDADDLLASARRFDISVFAESLHRLITESRR